MILPEDVSFWLFFNIYKMNRHCYNIRCTDEQQTSLFLPAEGTLPSNLHGAGTRGSCSQATGKQHDRRRLAPPPELPPGTELPGRAAGDSYCGNATKCAQRFPGVADNRRSPQVEDVFNNVHIHTSHSVYNVTVSVNRFPINFLQSSIKFTNEPPLGRSC